MIMSSSFASQASMTSAMVCMIVDKDNSKDVRTNNTISNYSIKTSNFTLNSGNITGLHEKEQSWKLTWDSETQGWVVSSFFVGYYVMQLPSGVIVTRFGPKTSLMTGLLATGILHMLSIPAARWNLTLLYVVRSLAGLTCGCIFPGVYALIANWSPEQESSFLISIAIVGIDLGNSVAFFFSLVGCETDFQGGWPVVFYALGSFQILLGLTLFVVVTDFPSNHRYIDPHEARYISNNRAHDKKASSIPVRRILLSTPVWGFLLSHLAIEWMYYTLTTQNPLYLRDVLKLSHWEINVIGSVPFLVTIPTVLIVGRLSDRIIQAKIASKTNVRKFNQTFGFIFTATPVLILCYVTQGSFGLAFVFYVIAAIGLTVTTSGYMSNPGELSPAHAGFLASLGQVLSTWVSFVIPALTAYLTTQRDRHSWQLIFYIVVGIEASVCIFYLIFGSGNLQPWALEDVTEETPIIPKHRRGQEQDLF